MPINPVLRLACAALVIVFAPALWAQSPQPQRQPPPPQGNPQHGRPPPQAYDDCRGRKAGDVVQHTNPRGTGPAICMNSPEGLVARPEPPPGPPPGDRPPPDRR